MKDLFLFLLYVEIIMIIDKYNTLTHLFWLNLMFVFFILLQHLRYF